MSIEEIYQELMFHLRPDEVVVIHKGIYDQHGEVDTPPRTDQYGNPLLEIRRKANLKAARNYGWYEYRPPIKPKGVKSSTPKEDKEEVKPDTKKTTSKRSTSSKSSKSKSKRTYKRKTKKDDNEVSGS